MKTVWCFALVCFFWLWAAGQSASSSSINNLVKKAESGDAEAQFQLGRDYEDGIDVPQDAEASVKWYRKSAEQGNANAQNSLGIMYSRGQGVPRDKGEALRWYRRAAQQGLPEADFNIAAAYYNGEGVDSDLNRAYAWMSLARQRGNSSAEQGLAHVSQDLNGRLESGMMLLAGLYEKGEETPKEPKQAFDIYLQLASAEPKHAGAAQFKVCQCFGMGNGVAKDVAQAWSWCKTAAKNGIPGAMIVLGQMAENGVGTEKNLKEAERWYRDAISEGYPGAFISLGRLKLTGTSNDDKRDAYFWLYLASLKNISGVQEDLKTASANLSPNEINKEQKKAQQWLKTPHWKSGR